MTPSRPLRIAMLSPEPRGTGGVPGMARLVARTLAELGAEVDCWFPVENEDPTAHGQTDTPPGLHWRPVDLGWRWGRWYSRPGRPLLVQGSQLANRSLVASAIGRRVLAVHRLRPYDVVHRFSTIELFGLRDHLLELPPVVLHPEVHAAGELAGLRRERQRGEHAEPLVRRTAVELLQSVRVRRQEDDLRAVAAVIAPSAAFARHLVADHGLPADRITVVPNPIDLDRFRPAGHGVEPGTEPADHGVEPADGSRPATARRALFVGRISVRKGIADLVALSHRLARSTPAVHLDVVGGASFWSDQRDLLTGLDPAAATYHGPQPVHRVAELLAAADLLVQPSTYEPFALTVAEALASGTPVVVTTEVGAGEGIDPAVCRRVPPGDVDALHHAVTTLAAEMADPPRAALLRSRARAEAERAFAPESVGRRLLAVLAEVADAASRPATPAAAA